MRFSFGLWSLALSMGVALLQPGPAAAAVIDMDGLLSPVLPRAREAIALPELSGSLDEAAKRALATAMTAIGAEDYAAAEAQARTVTESHPDTPEGWYVLAMALGGLDRTDAALAAFDAAAARYTVNSEPLVDKGDLLLAKGRRDEAAAAWDAAASRDPSNWRAQERLAALAESQGDRAGALKRYEAAIAEAAAPRLYPRLQAARLSLLLGDPARVEALLGDEAGKETADDVVLDYLARAKVGLDKLDEAAALFDRAIARGSSPRPFVSRAQLAIAGGDVAGAEAVLARAAAAFPDAPEVLLAQGKLLGATGRYQEALDNFVAGLAKAPDDPALLRAASLAEVRLGKTEDALAHARAFATRPGASGDDLVWLASFQEAAGARDDAAATYRAALEKEPGNWVALNNLASLLTATAPDEAVQLAGQAAALAPDSAAVRDTLGWAQLQAGALDQAARTFEALYAADAGSALVAYRLGVVRQQQGRAEEGRALLQEALTRDPAFRYAEDARKRLQ